MIKIMIVDDMPIFLEYLRGCIDWNSYGFEICAEAHDGKEALEKIEEFYPDVILTDITMPYINGLELAEKVTREYPDISVILITGNNEFEYARKAVKIGVCDYIVKPFEKEELILSLLKLQDNIEKAVESSQLQRDEKIYDDLRALVYAGVSGDNALSFEKAIFGDNCNDGGYLLALIKFDTVAFSDKSSDSREKLMNWENLIAKLLSDKIEIDGDIRIFHDFENNIVVIMKFNDLSELGSYKGYELSDIIQVIKNQLEIGSSIALTKAQDITYIKKAYENALFFLSQKGYGQLWDLRDKSSPQSGYGLALESIMRLNKAIETLQFEDAENAINSMWDKLNIESDASKSEIGISGMNLLTSAVSILMTNIINSGFSLYKIYGEGFSPERFIGSAASSGGMKDNVIYLYKKRIDFEKGKKESKDHDIALAAKDYIEENYGNNELSISEISEKLCVNQTYLRKMFKSEMDMTLSEYITHIRMAEAKRLLTTSDEKLSAISEKVGFSDVSYFSNVFKKHYGVSPRSMSKREE